MNGDLSKVKGSIDKAGNADFTLLLKGRGIDLTAPNIHITDVERLDAPIQIKIPAGGGYLVAGPVSIKGGKMEIAKKKLTSVSGDIDMYISGPSKRFKSSNIAGTVESEGVTLATFFEMTKSQYLVHKLNVSAFEGQIQSTFEMGRKQNPILKADFATRGVALERMVATYDAALGKKIGGYIQDLKFKFQATRPNVLDTMQASGKAKVEGGFLDRYSIDASLKRTLSDIPFIGDDFTAVRGADDDEYVVEKQSARSLSLDVEMSKRQASISNFIIDGTRANIKGEGIYHFDTGFKFKGAIVFLQETFEALGGPIKPLRRLFGELGRIEIPFRILGPADKIKVRGDMTRILDVLGPTGIVSDAVSAVADGLSGGSDGVK